MINFAVGPVQMDEEIRAIGAEEVPYFRTPEFSAIMKENERLMKQFTGAPEDAAGGFPDRFGHGGDGSGSHEPFYRARPRAGRKRRQFWRAVCENL